MTTVDSFRTVGKKRKRKCYVTPNELRQLRNSPCCLNSKMLLLEIGLLIKEKAVLANKVETLKQEIRKLERK